ncbi:MAG: arginyltransferase [Gammaproteobacteria bacterium]
MASSVKTLNFFLTTEQACSYLPERRAGSVVVDPYTRVSTAMYSTLIDHGFRRNSGHIYRPHCQACESCISVRVPVKEFIASRSQKRVWRRNQDLVVRPVGLSFQQEHFQLYQRYLESRHRGGGMDDASPEQYNEFIINSGLDGTRLYEFRLHDRLLAVAVVDQLLQGWSAVYTFFDPDLEARSLGTHAILWQINEAQRLGLSWVYLGYWIKECRKMSYKNQFRPLEIYRAGQWLRIDALS